MFTTIAAVATAFNFLIIIYKLQKRRFFHASVDFICFAAIAILFSSTITGLQIGMIASLLISLYLLLFPPKLDLSNLVP